jgi:hypothetical protein
VEENGQEEGKEEENEEEEEDSDKEEKRDWKIVSKIRGGNVSVASGIARNRRKQF